MLKYRLLESWLSGRKRLTANEVGGKTSRGFESHTLRQKTKSGSEAKIWSARSAICSEFPPKNPESERVRHAERGSSLANTTI